MAVPPMYQGGFFIAAVRLVCCRVRGQHGVHETAIAALHGRSAFTPSTLERNGDLRRR